MSKMTHYACNYIYIEREKKQRWLYYKRSKNNNFVKFYYCDFLYYFYLEKVKEEE
jgi:hypothetical protein